MLQINTLQKKQKNIIGITSALAMLALLIVAFILMKVEWSQANSTSSIDSNGVNMSPATEQEVRDSNSHKIAAVHNDKLLPKQSDDTKKNVTPTIVDVGQYGNQLEIRSYVPGIIEDDGECSVILTSESLTITKKVIATGDASTTQCARVVISKDEMASGKWSVVVRYNSAAAEGNSQVKSIEIR